MADTPDPEADAEFKLRVPFRITPKGLLLFFSIVTTGTVGPIALARYAGVATTEDVAKLGEVVKRTKDEYDPKIQALDARVTLSEKTLAKLSEGQQDTQEKVDRGRAESIANIAADRVKDAKKSRQVFDLVFEQALDNLHRGHPIRAGLNEYLR